MGANFKRTLLSSRPLILLFLAIFLLLFLQAKYAPGQLPIGNNPPQKASTDSVKQIVTLSERSAGFKVQVGRYSQQDSAKGKIEALKNSSIDFEVFQESPLPLLPTQNLAWGYEDRPIEPKAAEGPKSHQDRDFFSRSTNDLITAAIIALSGITIVFFLIVIVKRGWGSFQSFRAQRIVNKNRDILQIGAENTNTTTQAANRLKSIGDSVLIEKIIDFAAERYGLTSFLRDLYDSTEITEKYIRLLENSKSWKKRAFSCEKLGRIGSGRAVPFLLSTARDVSNEDEDVRSSALRALGRIRDPRAIPFLIEALGSPESWLPARIAEILVMIGDETILPLTRELNHFESESRRAWAAEILGTLGAKSATNSLMESLLDASPEVRAKAAGALGRIKDEKAIIKLAEVLISEPVSFVRTRVAQALGAIGNPMVIHSLINLLKDPEWWVRIRAVEALEQLGEKSIPSLLIALEDEEKEVCRRAAMALEKIGYIRNILREYGEGTYKPELRKILFLAAQSGVVESLNEYLLKSGGDFQKRIVRLFGEAKAKGAAEPLMQLLGSTSEWTLKARIIQSLGRIGEKKAIPLLIDHLKDPEYWVRKSSVQSLSLLNALENTDEIANILKDPNPEARISALRALCVLNANQHGKEIAGLLSDPSSAVRANALIAIRELNIQADKPKIIEMLNESLEEVRIEAVKYFTSIKYYEAFYDVLRILPYASDTLRRGIVEYVECIKPKRFHDILDQLRGIKLSKEIVGSIIDIASVIRDEDAYHYIYDYSQRPDEYTREKAIRALIQFGFGENRSILEGGLFDPASSVRIAVLTSIGHTVDSGFMEKAIGLLDDPDEYVRLALALAIGISGRTNLKPSLMTLLEDTNLKVIAGAFIGLAILDSAYFLEEFYRRDDIKGIRDEIQIISKDDRFIAIVQRIKEESERIKRIEISLLFETNEREFAGKLVNITRESTDPEIRVKAMEMIKRIASHDYFTSILSVMSKDPYPRVREVAMDAVASLGREEEVISAFSASLADPVPSVRKKAAELLGHFKNPKALEALLHVLDTNDRDFRESVTTSLSHILSDDLDAIRVLIRSVTDKKTRKIGMAWIMGKTEKRDSIPFLMNLLNDKEQEVRCAAIGALSKFKNKHLSKSLEPFIYDPNERVRAAAVNAVTLTPAEKTTEALLKAMDDIDDYVRLRAVIGLSKIDVKRAISFLETKSYNYSEYRSYLNAVLYSAGIAYKESVINDSKALIVISELCNKGEMFNVLKESANTKMRYHAFKILSLFDNDKAYKDILELALKDPDLKIRHEAEKQIGSIR